MLLFVMAAASGLMTSPAFANGSEIVTPDDYPKQMLEKGQSAFEDVRIVVAPTGKPERCDVVAEVRGKPGIGADKLIGPYSCTLVMRRAKFQPAHGVDGHPIYGTTSAWISWWSGDGQFVSGPDQVDADISVAALPSGMVDPALIDVDLEVDAGGTPGACSATPKAKFAPHNQVVSSVLANVACSQFAASGKLNPAHTQSGEAVASVQRLVARFSSAKAPAPPPPAAK